MDDLEIITTSDGSHTLRNKRLNETYHSVHGAVQESMHVFIANGLSFYHSIHKVNHISVLEVGFGTGLNALLSLQYSMQNKTVIHYTSLEPFPLIKDVWSKLNYEETATQQFETIHNAAWDREVVVTPTFLLHKRMTSLEAAELDETFDVVFFDAFAPSVQPALWAYPMLEKVVTALRPEGVFVTYSAKGQLKRDLRSLGLEVETLPGPPGKLEMVRATKLMDADVGKAG